MKYYSENELLTRLDDAEMLTEHVEKAICSMQCVEIVRCKDCANAIGVFDDGFVECAIRDENDLQCADDFCSHGRTPEMDEEVSQ